MRILVISSAPVFKRDNKLWAYPPFVSEMDSWFFHFDEITLLAPNSYPLEFSLKNFKKEKIQLVEVPYLDFRSLKSILQSIYYFSEVLIKLFREMNTADHIHLRCPGNISLLGCMIQIFFPKKKKTVKYAGNWNPDSRQPWSYRLQKAILRNSFLSRNLKVLVYGKWKNQSNNVVPFFTASFSEKERASITKKYSGTLNFIFVGSLSKGKQPLFAIQLVEYLLEMGANVNLKLYGSGEMEEELNKYLRNSRFTKDISIKGFIDRQNLKREYIKSHFLILPSRSEGWPKAVAEAMFFGCIPVTTAVSCVPWMLANGKRGIIIPNDINSARRMVLEKVNEEIKLSEMAARAQNWSQKYTLEKFEQEIIRFL